MEFRVMKAIDRKDFASPQSRVLVDMLKSPIPSQASRMKIVDVLKISEVFTLRTSTCTPLVAILCAIKCLGHHVSGGALPPYCFSPKKEM